jgi:hypothetical protein
MGRNTTFYDQQFRNERHDGYDPGEIDHNLVFVAMPFSGTDTDNTYSAIKDECNKLGLDPSRVDENVGSGYIIREVIDLIERAEFAIFDLSEERPNVYYELGYAHGVGNEAEDILLIAKAGTSIHFDITPLRIQLYNSTEHLRSIINESLKQMIQISRR